MTTSDKPFKCTCGFNECTSYAKTRRLAAQLGASHVIARRSFDRWIKTLDSSLSEGQKFIDSLSAAEHIGYDSAAVAAIIADHLDILEEGIAHYCQFSKEWEKT